ncbi:Importin alpha subunit (Karyopherin alpha subunit) (Serine-rich RNA polymerase I suppressor protein) [Tulasnella sp. 417]|nr:Importin alpha subunit (Karyopherin alpha subunit) (Serine-rich RNA polymerase I suppressor protein) [Tulasnella sp. 417]
MSARTEDIIMEDTKDSFTISESAKGKGLKDGELDESRLAGCLTEDNQIAPDIVGALRSNDRTKQLDAAKKLARLADEREGAAILPIINSGIISNIVDMISLDDIDLQVHLTAVLATTTSGSLEHTTVIANSGAIPKFVSISSSSTSDRARDDALLALGNIGGDSRLLRDMVIGEGGLQPILDILRNPSEKKDSHRYWAANALERITRSVGPYTTEYEPTSDIVPALTAYIEYQKDETAESLRACLLALCHILSDASFVDAILQTGIIPRLVQLCTSTQPRLRHTALRCVGRILSYSDAGTNQLTDAGIIEALRPCITSEDPRDRRRSCWAVSNIAAGTLEQAKALIAAGFVPPLVKVASDPAQESDVRGDAIWALASMAYNWGRHHSPILETLFETNCLEAFFSALVLSDTSAASVSLKSIRTFLNTWWDGKSKAIERSKAIGGVLALRAFKLRQEPDLAQERLLAHMILKEDLRESSLPPRV